MPTYKLTERQHRLIVESAGLIYETAMEIAVDDYIEDHSPSVREADDQEGESETPIAKKGSHPPDLLKFAKDCKTYADKTTGKIEDCEGQEFRCFSASQEALMPAVRNLRWHNYDLLQQKKTIEELAELIERSFVYYFPDGIKVMRLHVGGDFYDQAYFAAWLDVARRHPQTTFYAYTKALPYWVKHKEVIPSNVSLTASMGGTADNLIDTHQLKNSKVVFSPDEATALGREIDHDDSMAAFGNKSFATLIHGQQPAKSKAGAAKSALRKDTGFTGYGKKSKRMDEGVTYESHGKVLQEVQDLINTGRWESLVYIKLDGTVRKFNLHLPPKEAVAQLQGMTRYDPEMKNIKHIWDNNAPNRDGTRGAWRSAKLERMVYFKAGGTVYDFTKANAEVVGKVDAATVQALMRPLRDGNFNIIVVE